jgi:hypothetical protein
MKKAAIGMVALGSIAIVAAIAARRRSHKKMETGETAPEAAAETATDAVQPA